ncbi:hypothetical protein [Paraburkholderia sp. BL10I2N1]|uniref:hypothetical protein n=1 Tax=Paraburkholderia sp. BL10I2N1 TaxID=1938796 RepID=UPI00105EE54F|nr:hypothetical protein [Paraburkholderia sp. BL10I2N1]TDN70473.1 hypothetical protein B0G77_3947 [Paraburkholderia sp. BL10I2N1]
MSNGMYRPFSREEATHILDAMGLSGPAALPIPSPPRTEVQKVAAGDFNITLVKVENGYIVSVIPMGKTVEYARKFVAHELKEVLELTLAAIAAERMTSPPG